MDFVLTEADVETTDFKLNFSDDEEDMECESAPSTEDEDFIDDGCQDEDEEEETDPSIYRSFDNREDYSTFKNRFKDPVEASKRPEGDFFGKDDLSELFIPEERGNVTFHSFKKDSEKAEKSKKSLRCFSDVENHFFYAVVYGLMHEKLKKQTLTTAILLKDAEEVLGTEFFLKLKEIEPDVKLDYTIFGFFDRCQLINNVLYEHGYFLRFHERRIKFRYQLRQKLK